MKYPDATTLALPALALLALHGRADQPEAPIACDEASEPLLITYGIYTTGCSIDPATDFDSFVFAGMTGIWSA